MSTEPRWSFLGNNMRILVCGPRDWTDEDCIWDILDCFVLSKIRMLISGCADGVDAISCEWANERGVRVMPFPARWRKHKNGAGPIRNRAMLGERQTGSGRSLPVRK